MTPIDKALETADTVQGAHRALEHTTTPQVRVLDREALRTDAWRNIGNGPEQERYVSTVLALFDRAQERGDGVAIYENHDLGHPEVGERQYVSFGSSSAQLETASEWHDALGLTQYGLTGYLPKTLPDIGGRLNWRYQLVAIVLPGRHETVYIDMSRQTGGRVGNSVDHG